MLPIVAVMTALSILSQTNEELASSFGLLPALMVIVVPDHW